mgnify:FL=1
MGGYKEVDRLLTELADDLELARDTCESHVKALASLSGNLQALYEYLYKGGE